MPIIITLVDDRNVDHPIHPGHLRRRPTTTQRSSNILPWQTFGRIATATDETRFVADLERRCGGRGTGHRRADITALLNALRGGLAVDELLTQAPGLRPERLVSAHRALEALRKQSAAAWDAIVATPDEETLVTFSEQAALLLPAPVGHLRRIAQTSPQHLRDEILRTATAVQRAGAAVRLLERRLDDDGLDIDEQFEVAGRLFDQHGDCALAHDDFLPGRVGALVPAHVSALLGEHRQADADIGAP